MSMKKIYWYLMAVLAMVFSFNIYSINACAETYVSTGEEVSADHLMKGDEFICEKYDLFKFRVVKTASESKNKYIQVEITGFNPSPKTKYTKKNYENVACEDYYLEDYEIVGIADNAFRDNQMIKKFIVYSAPLKYIGISAFEGCTNLRYFSISDTDSLKMIKERAFYGCKSMYKFELKGNKLKRVGNDAFRDTRSVMMKIVGFDMKSKHMKKLKSLFKKAGGKNVIGRHFKPARCLK
ncbi:leucine-rich repeat protein [Butyrivibrio sp. FC2001]|uniref:leucine-rich repeat protein n=1 Tax=Butyrivibrio sp. FC2001 TaxID=1280671 RepID=UPI000423E8C5|nr:leucine-rich repeat protein [Butyrivibrio sp. FC2001]